MVTDRTENEIQVLSDDRLYREYLDGDQWVELDTIELDFRSSG